MTPRILAIPYLFGTTVRLLIKRHRTYSESVCYPSIVFSPWSFLFFHKTFVLNYGNTFVEEANKFGNTVGCSTAQRVEGHMYIKMGPLIRPTEGMATEFVRKHTNILVPV